MHIKQKKAGQLSFKWDFSSVSIRTKIEKRTLYWYKAIIRGRKQMHS